MERIISYFAHIKINDREYYSDIYENGLYVSDKDQRLRCEGLFPGYPVDKASIHHSIERVDNELWFFPERGDAIDIYDIDSKMIEHHVLWPWIDGKIPIVAMVIDKGESFIVLSGNTVNPAILIDKKSRKMKPINFFFGTDFNDGLLDVVKLNDEIIAFVRGTGKVLKKSVNDKWDVYLQCQDIKFWDACVYNGMVLFVGNDEVYFSSGDGIQDTIKLNGYVRHSSIVNSIVNKNHMYILLCDYKRVIDINLQNRIIKEILVEEDNFCESINDVFQGLYFYYGFSSGEEIVIPGISVGKEWHIRLDSGEVFGKELKAEKKSDIKFIKKRNIKQDILSQYLEYIIQK